MREYLHTWNEQTFKNHYSVYYRILVMHAMKFVSEMSVAEDIVQEVFMGILKLRRFFNDETELRSYLYTSVRNKALDYQKHRNIELAFYSKVMETSHRYQINDNGEEQFFTEEIYRRLFEQIDALPPRQREVFIKLMEGKKMREIAKEMNVSFETVKTQKERGLEKLRRELNPEMITLLLMMIG